MKKVLSLLTIVLLALPVFGQDELVITGGDIDALLGGGNRGNRGGRGNNNNQPQIPDPLFMFDDLKALLKNNKVPLDKGQEKPLQTLLTTETTAMRTALEAQFSNRGNANGNRGGQNREVTILTDLNAAVTKNNAELLSEIKAGLTPEQTAVLAKAEKDKKACTTLMDLINFTELRTRLNNSQNNGRGGGGGGLDLSGDLADLFGGGGGGGGGRGGNNNNQQSQILQAIPNRASCTWRDTTTAQRLAIVGDLLTKEKKPLTADQSTKFSALIETRMKKMTEELKAKDSQLDQLVNSLGNPNRNNNNQTQNQTPQVNVQTLTNNIVNTIMQNLGVQNNNNNQNNQNGGRGGRGGGNNQNNQNFQNNNQNFQNFQNNNNNNNQNNQNGGRGNNNQNFNPQAEIQKKNEELLDKVAASLKPEQGAIVTKMKYDQIKARGPVDRYRGILAEEGTPLTPEQATQIQQILNTSNTAVRTYAQGLVTTEINALEPGALQAAAQQIIQQQQQQQQQQNQDPRQNRGNTNVNNVNQNGVAQQIVAKVINQVSIRHAQQEKVAADTILSRVLTPAQQASYKVSQIK